MTKSAKWPVRPVKIQISHSLFVDVVMLRLKFPLTLSINTFIQEKQRQLNLKGCKISDYFNFYSFFTLYKHAYVK